MFCRLAAFAVMGSLLSPAAHADGLSGTWLRDGGTSTIRFSSCGGGAMCGNISWIKPGVETPAKVGQRVFFGMKPSGDSKWSGSAFNPEDGKTYAGNASLNGNTLTTQGCAMGGMICKSTTWTRTN